MSFTSYAYGQACTKITRSQSHIYTSPVTLGPDYISLFWLRSAVTIWHVGLLKQIPTVSLYVNFHIRIKKNRIPVSFKIWSESFVCFWVSKKTKIQTISRNVWYQNVRTRSAEVWKEYWSSIVLLWYLLTTQSMIQFRQYKYMEWAEWSFVKYVPNI